MKLITIILVLILSLTGCANKKDYDNINEYFSLKSDMEYFVTKIYGASNELDIKLAKDKISKYMTKQTYEELEKDIAEYTKSTSTISDLKISYIRKENSTHNLTDKINITFRIINGNKSQINAIEFIMDSTGLFNRYNVYKGIIEEK